MNEEQVTIAMFGNPGDGFYAVGPFEHVEDAIEAIEGEEGWVLNLDPPEEGTK